MKALREEGIKTTLVNPNIATIQTDSRMADRVHLLPVRPEYVSKILEAERPEGIMLGFGGQTALNCGVQLAKDRTLDKLGVKILGTPIKSVELTEDRDLFKRKMSEIGIPVPLSQAAYSIEEARAAANSIGYPVMIRVAYTLGGKGGGVAHNEYELDEIAKRGLALSLTRQVLVEDYLGGMKQIEYEVMRDSNDNCITVCNMENMFGMRIHTGDNLVIAPSQTLNNSEYHMLRSASLKAARAIGIIGECNIQFALDTKSDKYYAIEVNARLSRSSALASKATGYPLAYVAAKLGLGYTLTELRNSVTGVTTSCFEPSLDYVVMKFPRWDLQRFGRVNRKIGTSMKSVGEVMGIGSCFEEAIQKAIRMLEIDEIGLSGNGAEANAIVDPEIIEHHLTQPTDDALAWIVTAIRSPMSIERISELSEVDPWFLYKIQNIIRIEKELKVYHSKRDLGAIEPLIREAKRMGFSDRQLAFSLGISENETRKLRSSFKLFPSIKQIDTLAAEWPAKTNYLYTSYGGDQDDVDFPPSKKLIVLGAGSYRIGSSVEFDWCTMNMIWSLKERGIENAIIINCNPETVSTDYDMSDRLYFEELTLERVLDIYEKERPEGIITCVGGQTSNNLTPKLAEYGVKILGTEPVNIDRAEDRSKFSALLEKLEIPQPEWSAFDSLKDAYSFAERVGYPLVVRPSYVLSGAAMSIAWTPAQLERYLVNATRVNPEHPVVLTKFIRSALEIEVDAVSDGESTFIGAIVEHVEKAGVHSGDAIMSIPPKSLNSQATARLVDYTNRLAKALVIKGPFNVQYMVKDEDIFVIECNLRASRSMPFVSKTVGVNLMNLAARALLGEKIPSFDGPKVSKVSVKVPQFSFMQLDGADTLLGVEMQSTGEVACSGENFHDALIRAMTAAGYRLPRKGGNILVTVGGSELKEQLFPLVEKLRLLDLHIHATEHTADFLNQRGVGKVTVLYKIGEPDRTPNIAEYLANQQLDLVINIPSTLTLEKYADTLEDEYMIRRKAVELGVPVLTNVETAEAYVDGLLWLRKHSPEVALDPS